ncbi:MAG: ABC transporter ATP-binding protein [Microcoleaceae cyanobacterium]
MLQTATSGQGATETNVMPLDIELRKVFKVFNGETAVRGVDLEIRQGEFFSILGPSGCGKTTTLRLISGFEIPTGGEVLIRGKSVNQVPAYQRPVNTVFQSYALFNHLNVWDNIAFGLRIKRQGKAEIEQRVREVLQLAKLEAFAHKFPYQLSGGQQQRVALARALVNRPAVLLLDEPLGALDLKLRKQMQLELTNLHHNLGMTFIMVTHDQEEAMSMSDRIAVMNEGRIEQIGSPSDIYEYPQTPFIADFIGDTNFFRGRVEHVDPVSQLITTDTGLKIESRPTELSRKKLSYAGIGNGTRVVVSVRPEKISLSCHPPAEAVNGFSGHLINSMYLGTHVQYLVQLHSGEQVTVRQTQGLESLSDQQVAVYVSWQPTDCTVLGE